jgi:hypothetical protein
VVHGGVAPTCPPRVFELQLYGSLLGLEKV